MVRFFSLNDVRCVLKVSDHIYHGIVFDLRIAIFRLSFPFILGITHLSVPIRRHLVKLQHDSDDCSCSSFAFGPRLKIDLNEPLKLANEELFSFGRLLGKIIV